MIEFPDSGCFVEGGPNYLLLLLLLPLLLLLLLS